MFRRNAFAFVAVAASVLLVLPARSSAGLKQGDKLPDLTTFELDGKLPRELKGQVILLDFWAAWCGPCKSSFPVMEELKKKYKDQGLVIIAVSVDEKPEKMERFVKSANVSFTVVRDARQKLVAATDIQAMPTSFLIDRSGKVRFVHGGFDREKTPREYVKEIEELLREAKP